MDDFESFAKAALGTSDPERIAAFREAVKSCMEGDYDDEEDSDVDADMGEKMKSGKGKSLALLFGK
jgi:hypothetical protein